MKCPVCQQPGSQKKYRILRHNFSVYECPACHSEFQHPIPKHADRYYDEGYYTGAAAFNYQDERKQEIYHAIVHRARLKSIMRFLGHQYSGTADRLLDVGAAFGAFVRSASANFSAAGLDVSEYAVREGNKVSDREKKAATLFQGELTRLPRRNTAAKLFFANDSISVITLIEVAEHLVSPREHFAKAYALLKPGGMLVIQTANFEGWQAVNSGADYHYYLPGHLIYYTATGLKNMLKETGFREFKEFFPVDFSLWPKWRKAWGDAKSVGTILRYWRMTIYHLKSKLFWRGRPLTSSYVLYARK